MDNTLKGIPVPIQILQFTYIIKLTITPNNRLQNKTPMTRQHIRI